MAIADDRQRVMPSAEDLMPDRSEQLAYPEARLLTNPIEPALAGEVCTLPSFKLAYTVEVFDRLSGSLQVDDKYQYSMENKELKLHGWVSNTAPVVGFWIITPSAEFRNGGPMKQNLTSHVGPTCLAVSPEPLVSSLHSTLLLVIQIPRFIGMIVCADVS